jgi:hypothetical protein
MTGIAQRAIGYAERLLAHVGVIEPRLIDRGHLSMAKDAHLLVAITFHFVFERLRYLEEVVLELAAFPTRGRSIVLLTNTTDVAEQQAIRQVFANAGLAGHGARVTIERELNHSYDLTWRHKKLIIDEFLAPGSRYTHFVYLEDDERLTFQNFAYFVAARDGLRPFGLVPAFLRTEWSRSRRVYVNTDNMAPVILTDRPFVSVREHAFIGVDNPYCGAFILDRELAVEYAVSRSFDPKLSCEVSPFGVRERAAMGLTFEAPPAPFTYRVAVPVRVTTRTAPRCAWLAHLPNNYTDNPETDHGKIAMTDLFAGQFNPAAEAKPRAIHDSSEKLTSELEVVLRTFLKQSVTITSIVAIGCQRMYTGTGEHHQGTGNEAVLLRLTEEKGGLAIASRVPIKASADRPVGERIYTLAGLARKASELSEGTSGDYLIILPDHALEEMVSAIGDDDLGFRAVVTLSPRQPGQLSNENAWRLQRCLFDRGLVALGCVPVLDGDAHCFLASDAVRSVRGLGLRSRGYVTMSSLGSNGRFANQVFQYAYLKFYALRHCLTAATPPWEGQEYFDLDDPACAGLAFPELRFRPFTDDDRMLWDRETPPIDVDLWGYFQEIPECWHRQRPLLRRMFELPLEHRRAIERWRCDVTQGGRRTLVAIHVRRGDYRHVQHMPWFQLIPEDWYIGWLRGIWPMLRDPLLFVATDEPNAILPAFQEFSPIPAIFGAPAQTLPDHVRDFEVLRRADQLAICNSSFSRMAAILADSTQKCFCPSFEAQGFVPYEPWLDAGFWARFSGAAQAVPNLAAVTAQRISD